MTNDSVIDNSTTTDAQATDITQDIADLELNESVNEDEKMLTTIDNPHNPKDDYDLWRQWDSDNGYYTEAYIARLINMESDYDVDDEFKLNIITSKVIADILANDDNEIYALV